MQHFERILNRLDGVTGQGRKRRARCKGHNDTNASLEVTLELRVGLIACAVLIPQFAEFTPPPTPVALLRFARPGEPGLTPSLLALRPFFNFLVRWFSGHNAYPRSLFVDKLTHSQVRPQGSRQAPKSISIPQPQAIRSRRDVQATIRGRRRGSGRSAL